ncbi:ComEC/Rec2 family competence protein [Roseomonas sp. 18066]|uniref:ComEC/Rec2 family competence protein n=1 Tax=Roseomonas sp. 18066 TaxID=2681412 RepID=UPI00135808B7|nr:ComEC/Rec2 family competence protein [Roseomonas sp. 18066]
MSGAGPRAWPAAPAALLAEEWSRLPLWWPVALGAGFLTYFAQGEEPGTGALWLGLALVGVALLLAWRGWGLSGWGVSLAACACLGFGWCAVQAQRMPAPLSLPRTALEVTGRVAAVEQLPSALRVTLEAARWSEEMPPAARPIRLRLRDQDPLRPAPGEVLRVRALLRTPAPPAYPGAWDFQRDAFFTGLGGSGFALGPAERLGEAADPPAFAATRRVIEERVRDILPGPEGAIAAALITGSQSAIPPPAMAAMRDSGLAHLLSVSGLHMAIVIGLGFAGLRLLIALWPWLALRVDGKRLAAPLGLGLGAGYLLLTGMQVPMLRSFAMAALAVAGLLLGRRALSLRALGLAAMVVMAWQPAALLGPSFQMSFSAVLALLAVAEARPAWLAGFRSGAEWWRRPVLVLAGLLLTSLVAGLATMPAGLHHFGRLQLYGVAANLLAVPLTSFWVMPAGLLAVLLLPLGLEAWPLAVMGWGIDGILFIAGTVAAWPGAALLAPPIPGWGLALASFGLAWLCLWRRPWRWLGFLPVIAGLGSGALVTPPDILVSGDSRLIAFRTAEGPVLARSGSVAAFTRDTWLRGLGEASFQIAPPRGAVGGLDCTPGECRFTPEGGGGVALLLRAVPARRGQPAPPILAAPHCGQAALLLSAEPIRGRCDGTPRLDRFSTWRDGAHAVWLTPAGAVMESDRARRGARPWVPPPPVPRPVSSGAAAPPDDPAP